MNCEAADILYVGAVLVYSGWSLAFLYIVTESEQERNFQKGQLQKIRALGFCSFDYVPFFHSHFSRGVFFLQRNKIHFMSRFLEARAVCLYFGNAHVFTHIFRSYF